MWSTRRAEIAFVLGSNDPSTLVSRASARSLIVTEASHNQLIAQHLIELSKMGPDGTSAWRNQADGHFE